MRFWRRNVPTEPASDRDDPATIEQTDGTASARSRSGAEEEAPPAAEPEASPAGQPAGSGSSLRDGSGDALSRPSRRRSRSRNSSRLLLKIRSCATRNPNRRSRSSHPYRRPLRSSRDRRHRPAESPQRQPWFWRRDSPAEPAADKEEPPAPLSPAGRAELREPEPDAEIAPAAPAPEPAPV